MKKATRIIPASVGLVVVLIVVVALFTSLSAPATSQINDNTLQAVPTVADPVLDGNAGDPAWAAAPALDIPVAGGWYGSGTVSVKSTYNPATGMIYFLYQYADPDQSLRRSPWVKQADGSWKKTPANTLPKPTTSDCASPDSCPQWQTKDPNGAYEDKFAVLWNINTPGFENQGCAVTCHWGADRANGKFGRKYTGDNSQLVDMWHFKSVRTAPVGQSDDQYIDNARTGSDWGRHGDPKTGGGYSNNDNATKTLPGFTSPTQPAPPYWIMKSEETPFVDTYAPGDEIAGIRISAFQGDRANLTTGSSYADGVWTLEISRPLVTGSAKDVQFSDLLATYPFGVAVFDNASVEHSMSGLYRMAFLPQIDANSVVGGLL